MTKITTKDIDRGYEKRPTIANYLPWKDYNSKHKLFLLEDGKSLGVCFEVKAIPCEARPEEMMEAIMRSITESLKNAIPLEKENPWILQAFVKRINHLDLTLDHLKKHVAQQDTPDLTEAYLKTLEAHLKYITQPGGIFFDQLVTNTHFRGGRIQVWLCLYRRMTDEKNKEVVNDARKLRIEETLRTSRKLVAQLRVCGLQLKRIGPELFYDLVTWFNPKPKQTAGDVKRLVQSIDFPNDEEKPFGWDFSEQLFFSAPDSFAQGWKFDDQPHKVLTIQSLSKNPEIGHLTAERKRQVDDKVFTLVDHLPEGSIFSMNITFKALSETEFHLKTVYDSAIGHHAQAVKVRDEVETAQEAMAHGDYLFPVAMALYIKAESESALRDIESQAEVLLNSNGFKLITDDEVFPVDAYLRYLPMSYDYSFDQRNSYRSKYLTLSDIAKLLPFYGRSTGTHNPGILFYTRGGEPWFYDLFKDKTKNAHMLLLGETGTGKSNLLNFLIMHMLAFYNPRVFIVEAGGSFDLLGDYCQAHGLSVNKVKIDPRNPVSLNPFASGLKILDQLDALDTYQQAEYLKTTGEKLDEALEKQQASSQKEKVVVSTVAEEDENESPDILGDMVLATLLMITGGEHKEEERITRADRMLVMDAIIYAAKFVRSSGKKQMIASDIIEGFERLADEMDPSRDAEKIKRAREMADSMRYFTKDPVSSRFFNSYGDPWPLTDVTIVNMGQFANEGNEAQRSIAFAGCVSKILALAEANQYSNRPIIALFDENHLFTKIPLLAAIQTRITKMGRKLGLWAWLATQNLRDFSDEAHKMLAMIETWICLALPPDEIDQIERFKPLTSEQRALFLSARKSPKQYTEGVLLSPKTQGLFRNVPPRLYLALAMTEQDEKNHRRELMERFGVTEIEAAEMVAKEMMAYKPPEHLDD
ncbi:MAG: conjugative transfer ATPase, family [Gammaproteobacteria bacterium]|jgi:conjugative transfer ATPase|nr:conjugative transfer ATPase, family [Gammaproteobacteria bacterium]